MTAAGAQSALAAHLAEHVRALVACGPDRDVANPGNSAANDYFERAALSAGFAVERIGFDCVSWVAGGGASDIGAQLRGADGAEEFEVFAGPYSRPYSGQAPLVAASTLDELAALGDIAGSILLLHGDIVAEQLTPKHYPFYNMDQHKRILAAIENARPDAVIAATSRNAGLVGAIYPFPLIEDAAVDIPSAFMRDVDGERLRAHAGKTVALRIDSDRAPDQAEQLVARKPGTGEGRILVMAHIDTRKGTPGALDNATGVACLLGIAEEIAAAEATGLALERTIELLPFNGEDNYAAPGEVAYLDANPSGFEDVVVAINIDAAGYLEVPTAISTYGCTERVSDVVERVLARADASRVAAGPQWPMSDHMVFVMRGVPAIAVTSREIIRLEQEIAHTERDVPELVDAELLADTVRFLGRVISDV